MLPPPNTSPSRLAVLVVVLASTLFAASPAAMVPSVHAAEGAAIRWHWPLDGPRMLVRPYRAPPTPYGPGHRGTDIGAGVGVGAGAGVGVGVGVGAGPGVRVLSPADGIVHFAGVVVDRPVLSIRHRGGLISSFEPVTSDLVAGDSIRRGQQVGVLQPGHCSEPCLHFGVRLLGQYLSPLNYLGGIPHSVLLPTRPLR